MTNVQTNLNRFLYKDTDPKRFPSEVNRNERIFYPRKTQNCTYISLVYSYNDLEKAWNDIKNNFAEFGCSYIEGFHSGPGEKGRILMYIPENSLTGIDKVIRDVSRKIYEKLGLCTFYYINPEEIRQRKERKIREGGTVDSTRNFNNATYKITVKEGVKYPNVRLENLGLRESDASKRMREAYLEKKEITRRRTDDDISDQVSSSATTGAATSAEGSEPQIYPYHDSSGDENSDTLEPL